MRALGGVSESLRFISGPMRNPRGIQGKGSRYRTQSDEHLRSVKAVCRGEDRNQGDQLRGFSTHPKQGLEPGQEMAVRMERRS